MIRLFVGLPLPETVRERLGMLASGVPGARWVPFENLHLTLRFIGEVDGPTAGQLAEALDRIEAEAFDLALAGVGCFASRRRARVLWAAAEPEPALAHLYEKVESALVRAGCAPEGRKFKAHVTLARLKDSPRGRVGPWVEANNLFRAGPFRADAFVLFSSTLGREGSVYAQEAVYPLR
jgi:2'-5' RNA ligase